MKKLIGKTMMYLNYYAWILILKLAEYNVKFAATIVKHEQEKFDEIASNFDC